MFNHTIGPMVWSELQDQTPNSVESLTGAAGPSHWLYIHVEACFISQEKVDRNVILTLHIDFLPTE